MRNFFEPRAWHALAQSALAGAACVAATWSHAALTDVSQTPLLTASSTPVKPNLMFVLDDSGSMAFTYLPEVAGDFQYDNYYYPDTWMAIKHGLKSIQCNGLAYDPDPKVSYSPPLNYLGAAAANASIDSAMYADQTLAAKDVSTSSNLAIVSTGSITLNGIGSSYNSSLNQPVTIYDNSDSRRWMLGILTARDSNNNRVTVSIKYGSGSGTISQPVLGKGWPQFVYFTYSGTQPRRGYTYAADGTPITTSTFYSECNTVIGSGSVFTPVVVRSNSAEAQRLANWWAYYSDRMKMMKAVVSQAFRNIDDNFRVGYMTIHAKQATDDGSKKFLHISDFTATQKAKFYDYVNAAPTSNSTPLRGSLALAGRYYARKASGQGTVDPVQYSCQRNYVIVATDGAWNTGDEDSSIKFGPYDLSGYNVGQRDSQVDRPYQDASKGSASGGSSDSLADVAMYYYATDLRTTALGNCTGAMGADVCNNNVKPTGTDAAQWQHMTTFAMSLGQDGTLKYDPNYLTQTSGDYKNILQGTKVWPNPTTDAAKVDDLWHAAVNGRGVYFNAADPTTVTQGLQAALATIKGDTAFGSAAATSSQRPVPGNDKAFVGSYTSADWIGDLRAYQINLDTGAITMTDAAGKDTRLWSAAEQLKSADKTARKIYYAKGQVLRDFQYSNLVADGFSGDFDNVCSKLSHCASLSTADQTTANSGANLVSYLRGTDLSVYRSRLAVLGDIVNSAPVYLGASPKSFGGADFLSYAQGTAQRRPMVYVGANDGMLHAFDAATGNEVWAFVPSAVRANLYKLADRNYATNHQFYVDGQITLADAVINGAWRTVLIAGLGAGGKSYVALDVTDTSGPPTLLWEFSDSNLGYTFAQALVVQRASGSGEWVAVLSSGVNNVGDGQGRLYMVSLQPGGAVRAQISTGQGSSGSPAGLGPLAAWADSGGDAVAKRYYAGDLLGNVWRFDPDGTLGTPGAVRIAQLLSASGVAQPVTTAPVLAEINDHGFKTAAVFVGTGRLWGLSDVSNVDGQSIYGIRDRLTSSDWGNFRNSGAVAQTLQTSGNVRTATKNPVDWSTKSGWYVDLPDAGERINVPMLLQSTTLVALGNVPQSVAACVDGEAGYSWLYMLDIATGSAITDITRLSDLATGLSRYVLPSGKPVVSITQKKTIDTRQVPPKVNFQTNAKKVSWRELIDRQ